MTTAEQIGLQIRAARGELSVRALSQKVGVTPPTITSYESGNSIPTADTLAKIADVLSIPIIEVDEHRFTITRKEKLAPTLLGEQLALDFTGEYSFSKATVRLSPGRISISFDGATPYIDLKVS
ncbi:MAG TPA: helix-turn-helix transcriptional regulator [Candidatus Dormibacteraeota bacterium]|jgi:transcriptional regulator with XRE-family HTH domain|nr:helix-turn-helix transcriptional regulator [Candidatus Dormibacteraeota bacterium]